ncbi:MAG TPA: bifunctional glycosyltransferase family 2/GtrA family protein, partial [Candidatus Onthocola stercorigallinarum]|nr:bifunctional glycosyltransferase family 2/GtrA family protein [Candidatus Onthocola stercorigallinarum]
MNKDAVILIPAYNPDEAIMQDFLGELNKKFKNIVIVNDGSDKIHDSFFEKLSNNYIVIKHYKNLGKGRALKTGINYILNEFPKLKVIVTADCDGQHSVKDIENCFKASLNNPDSLVLGTRNFNDKNVPFKSKYGNKITRNMFKIFVGIKITDTQTGLRAISKAIATKFLDVAGERYEYETNMLITCKNEDIKIYEEEIDTVYINGNELSHFNHVKDSIMIYKLFIKYILAAISSFVVDILLFTLILSFIKNIANAILISTILARIISSLYNYLINSKLVFKKMNKYSLIKYFTLVIIMMFVSGFAVNYLVKLSTWNATLVKIIVDAIIFVINFII